MTNDTVEPKPKKPFYKKWGFWWCVIAFIMVAGAIDDKEKDGGSTNSSEKQTPTTKSKKQANFSDARRFTEKHLASRYGKVVELSSAPNGSYFGFPEGNSVFTFAGTVLRNNLTGGPPTLNVVIAVQFDGEDWTVAKVDVN